ncbi:MAG: hypothetical protein IPJ65_30885 [Archangiaceae bacterium]|nr:hypothetical protein [Archangiaceae bacterium]
MTTAASARKASRGPRVLGAAAVLVAGAAVGLLAARASSVAPTPAPALVGVAPAPPVPAPAPAPAPAPVAEPTPAPTPMPAPVPAPAPVAKPQPVGVGKVDLRVNPWADVFEGKKRLGTTPLPPLELAAGTHTLTLVNPELKTSRSITVKVPRNGTVTQRVDLLE